MSSSSSSLIPISPLLAFAALLLPARAGEPASAPASYSSGDWEFTLSAGPAYRQSGTLNFTGGSRSGGLSIPSLVGQDSLVTPPIGSANGLGDRTYNDGYVRQDPSTGTDGYTQNWGYQNSSQVSGDNIAFHATGFQSIRSDSLNTRIAPRADEQERTIAPVIQFDATYNKEFFGIRPGLSASFTWSPISFNRAWNDFSLTQTRTDFRQDITDLYNLGGLGSLIPSAPYAGTGSGPGFLLGNVPDSRSSQIVQIGSENAVFGNRVTTHFDADHFTFSFGPTLEKPLGQSWNLQAGLGVAVHWLSWSASQNEILSVTQASGTSQYARWHDSSSGDKILGGLYLQLGAEWSPGNRDWSLKTFMRTDLGDSFSKQIGPSRVTYDTDGFMAALMLSRRL
jgi:hypothetical protein